MSVFHYLVKNDEGSRSEGDIRAESMDLAIQKLTSNGQIVITLKEVDTTFDFLGPFLDEINLTFERLKNRVPLANIVFFTRQLATMFSAGLTLERAISALSVEEKHKKFKKIQLPLSFKKNKSNYIIKNNFTKKPVRQRIERILKKII